MTEVLAPEFRNDYLPRHQRMLKERYELASALFTEIGVPHEPTESGLCLWLNLRDRVALPDGAAEMQLYEFMLNEHRVHISPGSGFKTEHYGFFRQDEELLREGIKRIAAGLAAFTKQ
jgi:1-aminocyclopropane-1-carboxylate synthase